MINKKLSIVVPTRNEEKTIIRTLSEIEKCVKVSYRIIVVDDSTDKTPQIVKKHITKHKNVVLLVNKSKKKGFSRALKKGFDYVKDGPVVPVMGDLCDNLRTLNKMYKKYQNGYDIVCGSRYMKGGGKVGGPKWQGFFSELVCRSVPLFTRIKTHDISNSFKLYRKEVLENVIINLDSGPEISMDLTLQAFFKGYKVTEVPTVWKGRVVGFSKFNFVNRGPYYLKIYLWAFENSLRKIFKLKLKEYAFN